MSLTYMLLDATDCKIVSLFLVHIKSQRDTKIPVCAHPEPALADSAPLKYGQNPYVISERI